PTVRSESTAWADVSPFVGLERLTLIAPSPAQSTLLPYTTLFRSRPGAPGAGHPVAAAPHGAVGDVLRHGDANRPRRDRADRHRRDRKSTRLNSSHVKISYAVFCLKATEWQQGQPPEHLESLRNEP